MWHGSWLGFTLCANAKLSQVKPQYFFGNGTLGV